MKDRVCPEWKVCGYNCKHKIPHEYKYQCDDRCSNMDSMPQCIKIPDMWLDKSEEGNQQ